MLEALATLGLCGAAPAIARSDQRFSKTYLRALCLTVPTGNLTQPPHMTWADSGVAEERLDGFTDVTVTRHDLPWMFDSVEDGMALYREGSPTHAFSFARAGEGAGRLEDALRSHLEANARASGRIESFSGYVLITARAPGGD